MRILVLCFSALEDIAMTVPVFRALFEAHPELQVSLVTSTKAQPMFKEFKRLQVVPIVFNAKHWEWKALFQLFRELKAQNKYTAVADLQRGLSSFALGGFFQLSGYRVVRVNNGRKEQKALTRSQKKIFKPLTHAVFRYATVFQKLGFEVPVADTFFASKPQFHPKFTTWENPQQKWIGMAPFAVELGKRYPLDQMQKVIAYLQQKHRIFLFGGETEEKKQGIVWAKAFPNVVVVEEELNFEESLDLIPYLDLMISLDSAYGHMGANAQVPVVSIWGQTHPYGGSAPFGQSDKNALIPDRKQFPELPVSVDGNKKGIDMGAIFKTIPPKKILEKILEVLD